MTDSTERAVLAGGCFWGMQDLIRKYSGVIATRVGYTGGDVPNATYRRHGTHAEAIEIIFDPSKISYRKLLEFFFQKSCQQVHSGKQSRSTRITSRTIRTDTRATSSDRAGCYRRERPAEPGAHPRMCRPRHPGDERVPLVGKTSLFVNTSAR